MRADFRVDAAGEPYFIIVAESEQDRQILTLFTRQSKGHIRIGGATYDGYPISAYRSMQVVIDKVARDGVKAKEGAGEE